MTPNKPLDPTSVKCDHINWHSEMNSPWSLCDDCGVRHVRAVLRQDPDSIHVEAGAKSISRALAQSNELVVADSTLGVVHLAQHANRTITACYRGQPTSITGL